MNTAERVKQIIGEEAGIVEIKDGANLRTELAIESLSMLEIIMRLEDEFEINITDETAENCHTVKDLVGVVETELLAKPKVANG